MTLAKAARTQDAKNNKLFYMNKNNPVVGNYRCVQGGGNQLHGASDAMILSRWFH